MATNYSNGEDGIVNGNGDSSSQEYEEKPSNDLEDVTLTRRGSVKKGETFGDEKDSKLKYRTMAWWLVATCTSQT